jgi:hypothetical protein
MRTRALMVGLAVALLGCSSAPRAPEAPRVHTPDAPEPAVRACDVEAHGVPVSWTGDQLVVGKGPYLSRILDRAMGNAEASRLEGGGTATIALRVYAFAVQRPAPLVSSRATPIALAGVTCTLRRGSNGYDVVAFRAGKKRQFSVMPAPNASWDSFGSMLTEMCVGEQLVVTDAKTVEGRTIVLDLAVSVDRMALTDAVKAVAMSPSGWTPLHDGDPLSATWAHISCDSTTRVQSLARPVSPL